jgi:hypothetical protein
MSPHEWLVFGLGVAFGLELAVIMWAVRWGMHLLARLEVLRLEVLQGRKHQA